MMNPNNTDHRLNEVVDCRFMNRDGAGVIIDRLSQPELVRLFHWFMDDGGCRSGALILENAPIFDTAIEALATLPPADRRKREGHMEEGSGDSGPDAASSPSPEGRPGRENTYCDELTPRQLAYGFFGTGILWGSSYLEHATGMSSSPFPVEADMSDFLEHVFSSAGCFNTDAVNRAVDESPRSPIALTLELLEVMPSFDFVIRSAYRLSTRCIVESCSMAGYGNHFRYLFFLGLLASGLRIPGLAWQSCYFRQAS